MSDADLLKNFLREELEYEKVEQFCAITGKCHERRHAACVHIDRHCANDVHVAGTTKPVARSNLEAASWNLDAAVNSYLDGQQQIERPAPPPTIHNNRNRHPPPPVKLDPKKTFSCVMCTYVNGIRNHRCVMCYTPKSFSMTPYVTAPLDYHSVVNELAAQAVADLSISDSPPDKSHHRRHPFKTPAGDELSEATTRSASDPGESGAGDGGGAGGSSGGGGSGGERRQSM